MTDLMESDGGARLQPAIWALLKGLVFGLLAAAAIVVWAVNVDHVFRGNHEGLLAAALRMMLCDAIPLATLLALFRSIGTNQSLERTFLGLFATMFWFLGGFVARAGEPARRAE